MNLREAAEAALEALVWEAGSSPEMYASQTAEAIAALRTALAEADEPDYDEPTELANSGPRERREVAENNADEPPLREPLTEEAIRQCYEQSGHYQSLRSQDRFAVFAFARAVERAHGIGTDE